MKNNTPILRDMLVVGLQYFSKVYLKFINFFQRLRENISFQNCGETKTARGYFTGHVHVLLCFTHLLIINFLFQPLAMMK